MAPQLAPPGSSTYVSNTLHVGDGTWDQGRDTFLLPNLVGLNFATMRYNGMGNRFAGLAGYKPLILGHAILAGITFLGIVPTAILLARFMHSRPGWALRLHIWLQIMTVILSTVVIILGFIAVGPKRNLTNPHHGIGLAIYAMILAQALGGWFVYGREKGKARTRRPIKVMMHQWSGRFIALLGLAQVPLGLTLWGSPLFLFVLYALFVAVLVLLYFVLTYRHEGLLRVDGGDSTYFSRSEVVPDKSDHRHGRLASLAATGAAGAAIASLMGHRHRSKSRSRMDVVGSHRPSASFIDQEKHSEYTNTHRGGGWKDRLVKIGAVAGAFALARKLFGGRKPSDSSSYEYATTEDSLSRVEDGRAPESPGRTARIDRPHQPNKLRRHRSHSADSLSSRTDITGAGHRPTHKLRDGVATLGAFGLARAAWKSRGEKKEQRRLESLRQHELEEERIARKNSQRARFTGDGFPGRGGRRGSLTETSTTISGAQGGPRHHHGVPPIGSGLATAAAVDAARGSGPNITPIPPRGSGPHMMAGGLGGSGPSIAAVPPPRGSGASVSHNLSGPPDIPVPPDPIVGSANRHALRSGESVNSPPVSVKVKMHNDGRHVTLRRLNEQEAAAEKEARRKDGHGGKHRRHRRADSVSSLSGAEASGDRWRRTEDRERREAEDMKRERERSRRRAEAGTAGLPPPPPIGGGEFGGSRPSVGSPGTVAGTYDGTVTEASDYANNRRRRRAERARAQERKAGTVDFH
ncbi:MAG: hypothetical protein M1814_006339 [Vezdaea aestivalis]|nr:MAG: hypothetical protein M1814_006339 [Vezdaea aestivalis]